MAKKSRGKSPMAGIGKGQMYVPAPKNAELQRLRRRVLMQRLKMKPLTQAEIDQNQMVLDAAKALREQHKQG